MQRGSAMRVYYIYVTCGWTRPRLGCCGQTELAAAAGRAAGLLSARRGRHAPPASAWAAWVFTELAEQAAAREPQQAGVTQRLAASLATAEAEAEAKRADAAARQEAGRETAEAAAEARQLGARGTAGGGAGARPRGAARHAAGARGGGAAARGARGAARGLIWLISGNTSETYALESRNYLSLYGRSSCFSRFR